MAKQTKAELAVFLKETTQAVEEDDSFEGRIQYQAIGRDEFEVGAFVRVGNSMGQGGCMLIEETKDPNRPTIMNVFLHPIEKELPPENNKVYFVLFDGSMSICRWIDGGWCDTYRDKFPPRIQKKFTHWADVKDYHIPE